MHEAGLGPARIRKLNPDIPTSTICSWIYTNAKPLPEPVLTPSKDLAHILGTLYGDGLVGKYRVKDGGYVYPIRLKVIDIEFVDSFK